MDNPCPTWLADPSWDNITELAKLPNFQGITMSFEQNPRDWNMWFTGTEPENSQLPGDRAGPGSPVPSLWNPPSELCGCVCLQVSGRVTVTSCRRC